MTFRKVVQVACTLALLSASAFGQTVSSPLIRVLRTIARLAMAAALFIGILAAQTGSGIVQGVVKDVSGAVLPGAKVILIHNATAREYATTANEVGFFMFPPVQPGTYGITVTAAGMETWKASFLLVVGQTVEISPVLKAGTVTTQVTVVGEAAPLISTTEPTISRTLERTRIEQLPLNGRSIANMVLLSTPGLVNGQDGAINPINTGLRDAVELYQDGAVIKNRDVGIWSGRLPGLDSIEELRVETNLSSAQYPRPGSVILSTKSGTNRLHGSAFETNRNSGMGVARRRQDYYDKPPHYVRNEFGASFGGPVYIPKLYNGKNRTFFFTSYEALRQVSSSTFGTTMQTEAMRHGDYSGLVDSLGRLTTIYDPLTTGPAPMWTRAPFPNNTIPESRMSPNAKYMFSIMPSPTFPDVNPMIANNWFGLIPSSTMDYMVTNRIDERVTDHDQVFLRASVGYDKVLYVGAGGSSNIPPLSGPMNWVLGTYDNIGLVGSWSHTISPRFLSSTRASFYHEYKFVGSPSDPNIPNMPTFLGLPNLGNDPWTSYSTSGMGFGASFSTQQVRFNTTRIVEVNQDFTRLLGWHQLQFGAALHLEFLNALIDHNGTSVTYSSLATGLFDPTSGSSYSAVPRTGFSGASFFLGYVSTFKNTLKRPAWDLRDRYFASYIQDNWKISPRLTLNLGLRYASMPAQSVAGNYVVGFDWEKRAMVLGRSLEDMYAARMTTPTAVSQLQALGVKFESAQEAGLPSGLIYGNPWVFSPRLGFAYRLGDTTKPLMLRGGWGLYDSQTALRTWDNLSGSAAPYGYPVQYSVNNQALAGKIPYQDGLPNYELRSTPVFVAGVNTSNVLDNPAFVNLTPGSFAVQIMDPYQPPTRAHEWNFSVGREVLPGVVAKASYVGTHGWHIPQNVNFNAAPNDYVWYTTTGMPKPTGLYASTGMNAYDKTTYGSMTQFMKRAYSNASSVILEAERRYSQGVGFQFAYVMTNAFTESTLVGNGGGSDVPPVTSFLPGAVPTDFDARNRFLNYVRDAAHPHHELKWNWVLDLPFGKGKLLARNAGRLLNGFVGGWQLAGTGSYNSRYWSLPTTNWGPTSQIKVYGTKYPIQDCSSGRCLFGYLFWNGYISPSLINRTDAAGHCTGICGIPSDYTPSNVPLIPYGSTVLPPNAPSNTNISTYWDTNSVWIRLNDGSVVRTSMNTNLHWWRNQYVPGPWAFNLSASLFKSIPLREAVQLRFNADFFQVLNNPGLPMPGSNGILSTQNSSNSPRTLQLTLRLSW